MGGVRAYVGLFRMPGYPPLNVEITNVLDSADRVIQNADDPVAMALDLAAVLEVACHVIRDMAADLIVEQMEQAS
jgi:hypothetical protein